MSSIPLAHPDGAHARPTATQTAPAPNADAAASQPTSLLPLHPNHSHPPASALRSGHALVPTAQPIMGLSPLAGDEVVLNLPPRDDDEVELARALSQHFDHLRDRVWARDRARAGQDMQGDCKASGGEEGGR